MTIDSFAVGQLFILNRPGFSPEEVFVVDKVADDYIRAYDKREEKYEVKRHMLFGEASLAEWTEGRECVFQLTDEEKMEQVKHLMAQADAIVAGTPIGTEIHWREDEQIN